MTHRPDANGYYNFRIIGLDKDQPRGHKFQSKVEHLDVQPELWSSECPYRFPDLSSVDIVKESDAPRAGTPEASYPLPR